MTTTIWNAWVYCSFQSLLHRDEAFNAPLNQALRDSLSSLAALISFRDQRNTDKSASRINAMSFAGQKAAGEYGNP